MAYDREVREYRDLVQAQRQAPDWPYPGMSYISSESAADERFEFWKELREERGERYAEAVYQKVHR